ncbi:MAG: AraC family transcriptional regulator N-terminal domain-containing protein [Desulfovibrionaceae bacterium]
MPSDHESRAPGGRNRLAERLAELTPLPGVTPSRLDGVTLFRAEASLPRHPMVYTPSILIVGQGRKRVHLGERAYVYDPYNYLVLSVPLPVECETEASPEEPLLGLTIAVDPATLGKLLLEMGDEARSAAAVCGLCSTPLTIPLADATLRLLDCLGSPEESRILGRQIVREITYRVLREEPGRALRALAARRGNFSQIARVLRRVHQEYDTELDVEALASEAHMSVSAFHHNFKAVTSTSPLQYLKSIRLHKARLLMVQEGLNAGTAAQRVGYVSPSQFSREFKRFFGATPSEETGRMRAQAG